METFIDAFIYLFQCIKRHLFIYLLEEIDEETEHFAKIRGKCERMVSVSET